MPLWVAPVVRWQEIEPADEPLQSLVLTGEHLITWPPAPFERTPTHCYRLGPQYWIWQPEVGGVVFTADGPDLLLQPLVGTDHQQFEFLVSRSWLPAIYPIWQRQVLHASAVTTASGDVVAFTGSSGAGKSTTAYALAQRAGWSMVADDTLAFSCDDSRPIALHPLRREARLRTATAEHFGKASEEEVPFSWPTMPLTLKVVYALDAVDRASTPVSFERLGASDAFPILLAQAHALSLRDAEHNQRLMRDYLALAADVAVFRLTFPKVFDRLSSCLDALEAHAAAHGVALSQRGTATLHTPEHDPGRQEREPCDD